MAEKGNSTQRAHSKLTERIIGVSIEVVHELGAGFLEGVYHKAMLIALKDAGLEAEEHIPISVSFRGYEVGSFQPDVIVDGKVLLELKAVKALSGEHQAQVINYLKATGVDVGLLINFGRQKLEWRRLYR
jgi:GxxExxY protein